MVRLVSLVILANQVPAPSLEDLDLLGLQVSLGKMARTELQESRGKMDILVFLVPLAETEQ